MLFDRIKALCDELGISLAELERRAGFGNGTIGKWQTVTPNLKSIEKVANVLGVTVAALLDGI